MNKGVHEIQGGEKVQKYHGFITALPISENWGGGTEQQAALVCTIIRSQREK